MTQPSGFLASFRLARSGSVAIIFALSSVPVIGIAGIAVDYTRSTSVRSRLNAAADAAVLAALKANPSDDPVEMGRKVFYGNVATVADPNLSVTSLIVKVNTQRTIATAKYTADVKLTLASIVKHKVQIGGQAEATTGADKDMDVYFVIDTSLSMQFPMDPKKPIPNVGGCFFSCHLDRASIKSMGSISRLDSGIDAFKQISDKISLTGNTVNFTAYTSSLTLKKLIGPTTNKNTLKNALDMIAFETSTHFGETLPKMALIINSASNKKQKNLILMGDGLEEHRNVDYGVWDKNDPDGDETWVGAPNGVGRAVAGYGFPGGTAAPTGFVAACDDMKKNGVQIYVIYTPNYGNYPSTSTWDAGHQKDEPASRNAMRSCASADGFMVADDPNSLTQAIDKISAGNTKLRISK